MTTLSPAPAMVRPASPSWGELWATFGRIGVLSFGGPAAQIALMHRVLVEEKRWLEEKRYLDALGFCLLLPGPEAMQLASFAGWQLRGVAGGLLAGALFVLPGAAVMLALAALYAAHGSAPLVATLFLGVKAAVLAIVVEALLRIGRRGLKGRAQQAIAALAFLATFVLDIPFPLVVAAAALAGAMLLSGPARAVEPAAPTARPSLTGSLRTLALGLAAWGGPVAALWLAAAPPILLALAGYFSLLAVVTFGGAYAVLAAMTQTIASDFGWLTTGEMMDALGLAETTPGPLILVVQFVGFLAAFREGGWGLGLAGAAITLWVTFVPCFLWVFLGAPFIERLSGQPRLSAALAGVTAAVVGVIASLSLWFALHVLFGRVERVASGPLALWWPDLASFDIRAALIALFAALTLLRLHWNVMLVLALSAGLALLLAQI